MRKFSQVLTLVLLPVFVIAQHTVSGTVTDASTGDALPGANVVLVGTNMGAASSIRWVVYGYKCSCRFIHNYCFCNRLCRC